MSKLPFNNFKSCFFGSIALLNVLLARFEEAESLLAKGINLDSKVLYNYGLRAYVRIRLDNFDGAISDCSKRLELKPDDASMFALRAWAQYCLEQYDLVVGDLEKAIEIEPKRKRDYQDSLRLIDSLQKLELDNEAIGLIDEILDSNPEDFFRLELLARRSMSFYKLEELDASLKDIDESIQYASLGDKVELHKMKADILRESGQEELAGIEKDKHQSLKQYQASISEWIPASFLKRSLAHILDGLTLALANSLLVAALAAVYLYINKHQSLLSNELMVSILIPLVVATLVISFLDSITGCFSVAIILTIAINYYSGSSAMLLIPAGDVVNQLYASLLLFLVLISLVSFTYHVELPRTKYQGSFGKRLLGLRLTSNEGEIAFYGVLVLRRLLYSFEVFLFIIFVVLSALLLDTSLGLILKVPACALCTIFAAGILNLISKPGLHSTLTGTFVSEVDLRSGGFSGKFLKQ